MAHTDKNREVAVAAFEHVLEVDPDLWLIPLPHQTFWSYLALEAARQHLEAARQHLEAARQIDVLHSLVTVYRLLGQPADADRIDRAISQIRERSKPARNPKDLWPRYAL